jgi:hypothetical protein
MPEFPRKKVTKSKIKQNQVWREQNPDYHLDYYERNQERIWINRFNRNNGTKLPPDTIPTLRAIQGNACLCGKEFNQKTREFLVEIDPNLPPDDLNRVALVCINCRRTLRKEDEF